MTSKRNVREFLANEQQKKAWNWSCRVLIPATAAAAADTVTNNKQQINLVYQIQSNLLQQTQ